jgi:hypothetical protein
MKILFITLCVVSSGLWGANQSLVSRDSASEMPQRTTDYDAFAVLAKNCGGCHLKEDHPGSLFLNRARLEEKEVLRLVTEMIETSQMPPEHKRFRSSRDGKKLLKWLKTKLAKVEAKS